MFFFISLVTVVAIACSFSFSEACQNECSQALSPQRCIRLRDIQYSVECHTRRVNANNKLIYDKKFFDKWNLCEWHFILFMAVLIVFVCVCIAFTILCVYAPEKRGKLLLNTICWNYSLVTFQSAFEWKIISFVLCAKRQKFWFALIDFLERQEIQMWVGNLSSIFNFHLMNRNTKDALETF